MHPALGLAPCECLLDSIGHCILNKMYMYKSELIDRLLSGWKNKEIADLPSSLYMFGSDVLKGKEKNGWRGRVLGCTYMYLLGGYAIG